MRVMGLSTALAVALFTSTMARRRPCLDDKPADGDGGDGGCCGEKNRPQILPKNVILLFSLFSSVLRVSACVSGCGASMGAGTTSEGRG